MNTPKPFAEVLDDLLVDAILFSENEKQWFEAKRDAKQAITAAVRSLVEEVIGEPLAYVATDDIVRELSVSWAIQNRLKEKQLNRLKAALEGEG